jgi:hypothetical protein
MTALSERILEAIRSDARDLAKLRENGWSLWIVAKNSDGRIVASEKVSDIAKKCLK